MIPTFVLSRWASIILLSLAVMPGAISGDAISNMQIRKAKEHRQNGNLWISYGPGLIASIKSAKLSSIVFSGANGEIHYVRNEYKISTAQGVEKLKLWLRAQIQPLLNTRPENDISESKIPSYVVSLYVDASQTHDSLLAYIPLSFVFSDLAEKDIADMIRAWDGTKIHDEAPENEGDKGHGSKAEK